VSVTREFVLAEPKTRAEFSAKIDLCYDLSKLVREEFPDAAQVADWILGLGKEFEDAAQVLDGEQE